MTSAGRRPASGARQRRGRGSITHAYSPDPTSVPAARRLVAEELTGVPRGTVDTVVLLVSELATNCVVHAGTGFELRLERTAGVVRVEVTDQGVGMPAPRHPRPLEPSGRGLQIVDMLATTWGVRQEQGGRGHTVWFTCCFSGGRAPTPAHRMDTRVVRAR